jgi:hypothetical protein
MNPFWKNNNVSFQRIRVLFFIKIIISDISIKIIYKVSLLGANSSFGEKEMFDDVKRITKA